MAAKIYSANTQFLTIAYGKDVGLDDQGRVTYFNPNETSLREQRLTLVLIYAVVFPAYALQRRRLVDPRVPCSVSRFLSEAWSQELDLGMPLFLEAKQALLKSDFGFRAWCEAQGVHVTPTLAIKSLVSFERSSLDVWHAVHWCDERLAPHPQSLDRANVGVAQYDLFKQESHRFKAVDRLTFRAWRQGERRYCSAPPLSDDWDPAQVQHVEKACPRPGFAVTADDDAPVYVDSIREFASMWPGGTSAFCRRAGVTVADFNFWVAGRAHLPSDAFSRVVHLANLQLIDDVGEWDYAGGNLLIATAPRATVACYIALSHGCDLRFSVEVLSPNGERLDMRCLLFASWTGDATLILFEDSIAEKVLNDRRLTNFNGAVRAPVDVWRTVKDFVQQRLAVDPESVGAVFQRLHARWLDALEARVSRF